MRKQLAVWGCGKKGEKLYFELCMNGEKPVFMVDNNKTGYFHGLVIKAPNEIDNTVFLLISNEVHYCKIKEELERMGRKEFIDFMPGRAYKRKMVIINANCYANLISETLETSDEFRENYYLYRIPPICENKEKCIDENLLKRIDVFIHQDIREENTCGYYLSDNYIRSRLKNDVIDITIPNLVGMGKAIYIQGEPNNVLNKKLGMPFGLFAFNDLIIDKYVRDGYNGEDITRKILSEKNFEQKEILDNFNRLVKVYKQREKYWDIKIMDYFLKEYKFKKMFYDIFHPTSEIMQLIIDGIFELLHIEHKIKVVRNFSAQEMPIYPEVKRTLGLNYGGFDEAIRINCEAKLMDQMDFKEYIREYLFWCHNVMPEREDA